MRWHLNALTEVVSIQMASEMPLKRKHPVGIACAPVQASEGSRFVECPICLRRIAHYLINSHIDDECGKSTSPPADATAVRDGCLPQPVVLKQSSSQHQSTGAALPYPISKGTCACLSSSDIQSPFAEDQRKATQRASSTVRASAEDIFLRESSWWEPRSRPLAYIPSRCTLLTVALM